MLHRSLPGKPANASIDAKIAEIAEVPARAHLRRSPNRSYTPWMREHGQMNRNVSKQLLQKPIAAARGTIHCNSCRRSGSSVLIDGASTDRHAHS